MAHTAGPYCLGTWRTNDGAVPIMALDGNVRIALVDCHAKPKRGEGWKTECAERDANAALFTAAPDLLTLAEAVAEHFAGTDAALAYMARAALAKARAA